MIFPKVHVYVIYEVRDMSSSYPIAFTDFDEAQTYYSENSLKMQYPSFKKKENSIECGIERTDKFKRSFCSHCKEATYSIEKWTDDIGHGMFRAFVLVPNFIADKKANSLLNGIARKHYSSVGTPKTPRAITGGAHVNVKPGYTEWTNTYAL